MLVRKEIVSQVFWWVIRGRKMDLERGRPAGNLIRENAHMGRTVNLNTDVQTVIESVIVARTATKKNEKLAKKKGRKNNYQVD